MKGYMAIVTVLILLAVTTSVAVTLTETSIDEAKYGNSYDKGLRSLYFSESCAEEALLRVKKDPTYDGGIFDLPEGVCEVSISNEGSQYSLNATSQEDDWRKHILVEFALDANRVQIIDWKEE